MTASLHAVLSCAEASVDEAKLASLRTKLTAAFGKDLNRVEVIDPVVVRRQLVEYLQRCGVSRGIVQSYEQLLMGVMRRAALKGMVEAPSDGPWSMAWQRVLDHIGAARGRSQIRSLAAWASIRGIEPRFINDEILENWSRDCHTRISMQLMHSLITCVGRSVNLDAKNLREQRLVLKASVGSIRSLSEVYGMRKTTKE